MRGIGAIVLAAGGSTRLGYPKQLVEYQGATLIRRAAVAARDVGCRPVVVVVGAEADKALAAIKDLNGITLCINADWESGLASSLRAGLKRALELIDMDALLITVADQPNVTTEVLSRLKIAYLKGHRLVAASYNGVAGVPSLFGREYFEQLAQLEGDTGAGSWLRTRRKEVFEVAMSEAALDIDTQSDVQNLLRDEVTDG